MSIIEKKVADEYTHGHGIVSKNVKSYADDPYFIKKAAEAKKTLDRVGLPGQKNNNELSQKQ